MVEVRMPIPKKRDVFAEKKSSIDKFIDEEDIQDGPKLTSFGGQGLDDYKLPIPTPIAQPTAPETAPTSEPFKPTQQIQVNTDIPTVNFTTPAQSTIALPNFSPVAGSQSQANFGDVPQGSSQVSQVSVNPAVYDPKPKEPDFNKPAKPVKTPVNWKEDENALAKRIAEKHGMTHEEFMSIIKHETAGTMSPAIRNSIGATGLIQFVPSTSAELLLKFKRDEAMRATDGITDKKAKADAIAAAKKSAPLFTELSDKQKEKAKTWAGDVVKNMNVSQQLELTDKYLEQSMRGTKGFDNAYTSIFAGNPDKKSFEKGTEAYNNNASLDKNKDGTITREEWTNPVRRATVNEPKAATMVIPEGPVVIQSEAKQRGMFKDAANIAKLANPDKGQQINEAINYFDKEDQPSIDKMIDSSLAMPGTATFNEMKAKSAGGLQYDPSKYHKNGRISVFPGLDYGTAVGVAGHEISHVLGKPDTQIPDTLTYARGDQFVNGGRPAAIEVAAKEGGTYLDMQQEKLENEEALKLLGPGELEAIRRNLNAPNLTPAQAVAWKTGVPQVKPSKSFDLELMRKTSGPSPLDKKTWAD